MYLDTSLVDSHVLSRFDKISETIHIAGQQALDYFNNRDQLIVETKMEPQDVVSIADREVEVTIVNALKNDFPEDGFLGEEQGVLEGSNKYLWVIDPIDGTACFLNGMHAWCISVALLVEGKIAFGLVLDPNSGELFSAIAGKGFFVGRKKTTTITASHVNEGVMGLGTSHRVPAAPCVNFIEQLLDNGGMFMRNGSGALMLSYVAAGRLIGYYEPHMNSWDCLAGLIMVNEAGGWTFPFLDGDGLIKGNPILVSSVGLKESLLEMTGLEHI